jgi:hypothetical protein
MSISSLADDEILRTARQQLDTGPIVDTHLRRVLAHFQNRAEDTQVLRTSLKPLAAESPLQRTPPSTALDALVKYIPTESVTLYVAATSAIATLTAALPWLTPLRLYWGFVALTPVLFLLIYIGKRRSQKLRFLPKSAAEWPWWKLIASTLAFMVWALALPPLVSTDSGKVVAAFGALLVSTILSLVAAVVEPQEKSQQTQAE